LINQPHVAVLFYRIGPYHFARLKAAAGRVRVTAVEFSNVDPAYAWDLVEGQDGFERLMLFTGVPLASQSVSQIFEVVDKALDVLHPAAVAVPGWYERCSLAALKWCGRHAVPAIIMSETTAWDDERMTWRELVKNRVVRLCSAALVGGKGHADYLARLGMERDRIFPGYDAVDNAYFADKAEESRKQKAENRKQFGLPDRYFLASARFVEKKNFPRLIQAYALYRKKSGVRSQKSDLRPLTSDLWSLVLLGDGPMKPDLCHLISDLGLQHCVLLPGFKQYNELPVYYTMAGAFVHASTTEQWGLVVNEAMASGLPVMVSNRCGCATALVQEGINGFTFDPYNVEQLAELMLRISAFNFPLSTFGAESQRIIAAWGPERFANGLQQAVGCALRVGPIKPTLVQRAILDGLLRR
jgi:glycosyltransferase involved in cell wall biosynthesis